MAFGRLAGTVKLKVKYSTRALFKIGRNSFNFKSMTRFMAYKRVYFTLKFEV